MDVTNEKQAETREQHTQKILRAIRNITQMIASQTDPSQLIHLACSQLTENMGYHSAWMALFEKRDRRVSMFAGSSPGYDHDIAVVKKQLDQGVFTSCMSRSLEKSDIHVVRDPVSECHACPLHDEYSDCAAFAQRLEYEGKIFGVITVSVPRSYVDYPEMQDLFSEVAHDLSFALNGIEMAQAFRQASEIIERSPAVALEWKAEAGWPVEYVSKNGFSIFGRTVQELLDKDFSYVGIIHPDDRGRVLRKVSEAISDSSCERLVHHPYRIIRPDNTVRWIRDTIYLRRDRSGRVTHYEGIVQDITEKKYSEDIVNMFFEQPMNLHLVAGLDGTIYKVNKGWHTILGYTDKELENTSFIDLVHPEDRQATIKEMQGLAEGKRTSFSVFFPISV